MMLLQDLHTNFKLSLSPEQYFYQDLARGSDAASLGTVYNFPKAFGLKSNDWAGLQEILRSKNLEQPGKVEHVLIFLARHGQGYHNIGEEYAGTQAWKNPSTLSDKGIHTYFPDARLTPIGQHQADTLSTTLGPFFTSPTSDSEGVSTIPWPQKFYVSPLHRALETSYRTWFPLSDPKHPYHPVVHESLREQMYIQHCNRRSTPAELKQFSFSLDPLPLSSTQPRPTHIDTREHMHGFHDIFTLSEPWHDKDTMFQAQLSKGRNETEMETTVRAYAALTRILGENWGKQIHYISITTHAGFMSGVYQMFGLQHVDVPRFPTGIVIPLVVRVEKVDEPITLNEVILSDSHASLGVPGHVPDGRTVDDVLGEIRDVEVYHRLIRLFEEAREDGRIHDQVWRDSVKAKFSPLERVVVRALF